MDWDLFALWEEERDGISIFEEKSGQLVLVYRYVLTIASGPIMIKRAIAFIKKVCIEHILHTTHCSRHWRWTKLEDAHSSDAYVLMHVGGDRQEIF